MYSLGLFAPHPRFHGSEWILLSVKWFSQFRYIDFEKKKYFSEKSGVKSQIRCIKWDERSRNQPSPTPSPHPPPSLQFFSSWPGYDVLQKVLSNKLYWFSQSMVIVNIFCRTLQHLRFAFHIYYTYILN